MLFAEIWTIFSIFAQTQSSNRDFPLYYREKILPRPKDKYYICTTKKACAISDPATGTPVDPSRHRQALWTHIHQFQQTA